MRVPLQAGEAEARPHVGAIVLNWNRPVETMACLQSLEASDWPRLTMIVVDNHSDEDIEAAVTDRFPGTRYVRNPANLGFSGGMNVGIRRALELNVDYVLLLNNDTVVDSAMVRTLVETAAKHSDAGILSPLVLDRDARDVVLSAGLRCNLRRAYQGRPLGWGERDMGQFRGVQDVDAVSGAGMLVPVRALRDVGLLDEALYLYCEDVEWSFRMRQAGWRVCVVYGAHLWHSIATSSGGEHSPDVLYYTTRNSFVVTARHLPLRGFPRLARHIEILAANLIHARRGRRPASNARAVLAAWRDYLRGRLGPRAHPSSAAESQLSTRGPPIVGITEE